MLPELAEKLFYEPKTGFSIITEQTLGGNTWKSYVLLRRAELTTPETLFCTRMHFTSQESIQALVVELETRLEAKELEAYRLAREKRYQADDSDETDEAGNI